MNRRKRKSHKNSQGAEIIPQKTTTKRLSRRDYTDLKLKRRPSSEVRPKVIKRKKMPIQLTKSLEQGLSSDNMVDKKMKQLQSASEILPNISSTTIIQNKMEPRATECKISDVEQIPTDITNLEILNTASAQDLMETNTVDCGSCKSDISTETQANIPAEIKNFLTKLPENSSTVPCGVVRIHDKCKVLDKNTAPEESHLDKETSDGSNHLVEENTLSVATSKVIDEAARNTVKDEKSSSERVITKEETSTRCVRQRSAKVNYVELAGIKRRHSSEQSKLSGDINIETTQPKRKRRGSVSQLCTNTESQCSDGKDPDTEEKNDSGCHSLSSNISSSSEGHGSRCQGSKNGNSKQHFRKHTTTSDLPGFMKTKRHRHCKAIKALETKYDLSISEELRLISNNNTEVSKEKSSEVMDPILRRVTTQHPRFVSNLKLGRDREQKIRKRPLKNGSDNGELVSKIQKISVEEDNDADVEDNDNVDGKLTTDSTKNTKVAKRKGKKRCRRSNVPKKDKVNYDGQARIPRMVLPPGRSYDPNGWSPAYYLYGTHYPKPDPDVYDWPKEWLPSPDTPLVSPNTSALQIDPPKVKPPRHIFEDTFYLNSPPKIRSEWEPWRYAFGYYKEAERARLKKIKEIEKKLQMESSTGSSIMKEKREAIHEEAVKMVDTDEHNVKMDLFNQRKAENMQIIRSVYAERNVGEPPITNDIVELIRELKRRVFLKRMQEERPGDIIVTDTDDIAGDVNLDFTISNNDDTISPKARVAISKVLQERESARERELGIFCHNGEDTLGAGLNQVYISNRMEPELQERLGVVIHDPEPMPPDDEDYVYGGGKISFPCYESEEENYDSDYEAVCARNHTLRDHDYTNFRRPTLWYGRHSKTNRNLKRKLDDAGDDSEGEDTYTRTVSFLGLTTEDLPIRIQTQTYKFRKATI